jgi:hypothetical protein
MAMISQDVLIKPFEHMQSFFSSAIIVDEVLFLFPYIFSFLQSTTTPIYHLEFCKRPILIRTLIDIINDLPNLDPLKISSVSIVKAKRLSKKEKELIDDVINYNKITKVYLENMIKFKEISHLIDLFPQMKYLQIGLTNDINIK